MKNGEVFKLELDIPGHPLDEQQRELLRGFEVEHQIRECLRDLIILVKSGCGNLKYHFEETEGAAYFDRLAREYEQRGESGFNDMRKDFMLRMAKVLKSLRDSGVDFLGDRENGKVCEEWNYGEWAKFTKMLYGRLDEIHFGKIGSPQIPFRHVGSPYTAWDFPKRQARCGSSFLDGVSKVLPDLDVATLAIDSRSKVTRALGLWPSKRSEPHHFGHYPRRVEREILPGLEWLFLGSSTIESESLLQDGKGLESDVKKNIQGPGFFAHQYHGYGEYFLRRVHGLQHDRKRIDGSITGLRELLDKPTVNSLEVADQIHDVLGEFRTGWKGAVNGFPTFEDSER